MHLIFRHFEIVPNFRERWRVHRNKLLVRVVITLYSLALPSQPVYCRHLVAAMVENRRIKTGRRFQINCVKGVLLGFNIFFVFGVLQSLWGGAQLVHSCRKFSCNNKKLKCSICDVYLNRGCV